MTRAVATPASGGAPPAAEAVSMLEARPRGDSRQEALEGVRETLDKRGKLTGAFLSYLEGMRADSPVESWDRLCFELSALRETNLAGEIARICRDMRTEAWAEIDGDDGLLSHILPMCAQFVYSRDDATESIRLKLASMSDTVSSSTRPAGKMHAFMVNMARFGSMADDRMILAIAEELYIRRGHLGSLCDICGDILRFSGRDRARLMVSTLVEDTIGSILNELQRLHVRAYASSVDSGLFPLIAHIGEHSPDALLDKCVKLLARRARSLGLAVPSAPRGHIGAIWASALAHRISARTQVYDPDQIARHAGRYYRRSYGFLGLSHARAVSRLGKHGIILVENASSAIALRELAVVRDPLPTGQDALGLLEIMLGRMERLGIAADPAVTKKWRSGMLGSRLWGSLLEMEMHLRLKIAGSRVLAVPVPGGRGIVLDLGDCHVEAYSPLDVAPTENARAARSSDLGPGTEGDMFGRARSGDEADRTVVAVDCTMGTPADLEDMAGMLAPALDSGRQPGALCLVRREGTRLAHAFLENSGHAEIQNSATMAIRRALELDLAKSANPAS